MRRWHLAARGAAHASVPQKVCRVLSLCRVRPCLRGFRRGEPGCTCAPSSAPTPPGAAQRAEGVCGAGAASGRVRPRGDGLLPDLFRGTLGKRRVTRARLGGCWDGRVCVFVCASVCVCVCGEASRPARRTLRGQSAAPGRMPPARTCRYQQWRQQLCGPALQQVGMSVSILSCHMAGNRILICHSAPRRGALTGHML